MFVEVLGLEPSHFLGRHRRGRIRPGRGMLRGQGRREDQRCCQGRGHQAGSVSTVGSGIQPGKDRNAGFDVIGHSALVTTR